MRLGRSVYPMCTTPLWMCSSPGLVVSTLPPASAAMSTITEPGFIDSTICLVMSRGAFLPGISAVVIMMSTSLHCSANRAISASINSLDISLA
uniref:Putative secreted protein n=1 Tax=Ixodes ricinus TaxID=34613 RepID=A0A6B0U4Q3_IXORI